MLRKRLFLAFSLLVIASMVLAACQPKEKIVEKEVTKIVKEVQTQVVNVVETQNVIQTQVVKQVETKQVEVVKTQIVEVAVEKVTPVPFNGNGGYMDQIVFTSIDQAEVAVKQIQAGKIDVYAYTVAKPAVFEEVKADANLSYSMSYGSYNELTFNPVGPEFTDGRLNPFSSPKIREAMNWLIDRNYIVQEIFGGLAKPKFTLLISAFADYARYVDVARELEAFYAYDPAKAKEAVTAEMTTLGATLGADGKWMYKDAPVTIIILIRTEDNRRLIGDYFATQLESIGFTADRQYKTRSEASPIWVRSDPAEGKFSVYTGGWINTAISRDQGTDFSFYYTPRDYPIPLFMAYKPSEEFDAVALRLRNNDFKTMDERAELFKTALRLSMQDSVRVWCNDQTSFSPVNANVSVAYDLAAGIAASSLWPFTIRFKDQEGGVMRVAQPGILVDPWNPVAGSNWVYDMMPIRATQDSGTLNDPYTGLVWPQRIEKADITVKEGLPVAKTLDWVTLTTAASIDVPGDAWADWDPVAQKFITASEFYTQPQTALVKSVVTYPADLWTTVKWHDGSPISMGDFVMGMIMAFERGKPDSVIYDAAAAENLAAFMAHFKAVKIVSTDPLVIETYDDLYALDAELNTQAWWPNYGYGPGAWHNVAIGIKAEKAGTLAFSADKADEKKIEWMNYIAGPGLPFLKLELDTSAKENHIPFAPTMSQYVTADEATLRWANLTHWYKATGHFWIGTGPYYLDKVFPIEGFVTLGRAYFPDAADKWNRFGAPMLAVAEVSGPAEVVSGEAATFDVYITFEGNPYPNADLGDIKFLLFDATGALATTGVATAVEDGHFQVVLSAEVTSALAAGSNKLEIAVTSKVVSIPSFASFEFVTLAP